MAKQNKTQAQVKVVLDTAQKNGFTISFSDHVFTITKNINPDDSAAFADCETGAYEVLSAVPLRGGSVWGTDGASVGGYVAMKSGFFQMNKSGEGKRFMAELQKALDLPF